MIPLTNKIKNDLSSNVSNLQYLVEIGSGAETIYISTNKQMFNDLPATSYEGIEESLGEQLLSFPDGWVASSVYVTPNEDGTLTIPETLGGGHLTKQQDPYIASTENGTLFKVVIDVISEGVHPINEIKVGIGHSNPNVEFEYLTGLGVNELYIRVYFNVYNDNNGSIVIHHAEGVTFGSITAEEVIIEESETFILPHKTYYEDLDLKVSQIKEKIDLKSKKIQLSSVNVTLTNFLNENGRLSDRLTNPLGQNVNVYLKTQSCETLDDCIQVAKLKITRYDHDDKTVKINADDISLETFYLDLPRAEFELKKDVNTFEHYDTKRIPILYGHLKNAPAIVYFEEGSNYIEENGIKLLCDSAYIASNVDIEGIKSFNLIDMNPALGDPNQGTPRLFDLSTLVDNVSVQMGDNIYNVHCLPFFNTSTHAVSSQGSQIVGIRDKHYYPQWYSLIDNVVFNTNIINTPSSNGGLWCHALFEPISHKELTYTYSPQGNFYTSSEDGTSMYNLETGYTIAEQSTFDVLAYSMGVQSFSFDSISDIDEYVEIDGDTERSFPRDVHFIGNLKLNQIKVDNESHSSPHFDIYAVNSPYNHDTSATNYNAASSSSGENGIFNITGQVATDFGGGQTDWLDPWARNKIRVKGLGANDTLYQYQSYFKSFIYGNSEADNNNFISRYSTNDQDNYPILDATTLILYYTIFPQLNFTNNFMQTYPDGGDTTSSPDETIDIEANWSDLKLRKTWINSDMWSKDYFVNARGRIVDIEQGVETIQAEILVYHEGIVLTDITTNYENKHLIELYKYLSSYDLKTKYLSGIVYELMIETEHPTTEEKTYLYDIDLENISGSSDIINRLDRTEISGQNLEHDVGWIMNIKAKKFGDLHYTIPEFLNLLRGFNLVYGRKIYNENQELENIEVIPSTELNDFNLSNGYDPNVHGEEIGEWVQSGYSSIYWFLENEYEPHKLIEKPSEIIKHMIEKEMIEANATLDMDKYSKSYISDQDNRFAFSISEVENSKDIIEKICEQSRLMFRYRPRDGMATLDTIKDIYSDNDVDFTIKTNNILKYSYTKSKIEDLCIGGCRVKYAYNYGKEELSKTTEDKTLSLINNYKNYYGIEDESNYELEIEAPYIQDTSTALKFRDFMFYQYKNQHLIVKFTMSTKDAVELEVGDIINFDNNPNGLKPYGKDITQSHVILNDQIVYPYFLITNISKNLNKIDIECYQLHELTWYETDETLDVIKEIPKPQPTGVLD